MTLPQHVYVVNCHEEFDGIYIFVDEPQARKFASRYTDVTITEEVVMDAKAGAKFLQNTQEDVNDTVDAPDEVAVACEGNAWGLVPSKHHIMQVIGSASVGGYSTVTLNTHTDGTAKRSFVVDIPPWGVIYLDSKGRISEALSTSAAVQFTRIDARTRNNLLSSIAHADPKMTKRNVYRNARERK